MPKHELISLDALETQTAATPEQAGAAATASNADPEEDEFNILYIRCPRSLVRKLRRKAFALSENRRKRVSQTDVVVAALRKYLEGY